MRIDTIRKQLGAVAGLTALALFAACTSDWAVDFHSVIMGTLILAGGLLVAFPFGTFSGAFACFFGFGRPDAAEAKKLVRFFNLGASISVGAGAAATLGGSVIMFQNFDDPSKIAPGFSVALLSLLYGVALAELFFRPLAARVGMEASREYRLLAGVSSDIRDNIPRRTAWINLIGAFGLAAVLLLAATGLGGRLESFLAGRGHPATGEDRRREIESACARTISAMCPEIESVFVYENSHIRNIRSGGCGERGIQIQVHCKDGHRLSERQITRIKNIVRCIFEDVAEENIRILDSIKEEEFAGE